MLNPLRRAGFLFVIIDGMTNMMERKLSLKTKRPVVIP